MRAVVWYHVDAMINMKSQSKQNAEPVLMTKGSSTMTHVDNAHGFSIREYIQAKKFIPVL